MARRTEGGLGVRMPFGRYLDFELEDIPEDYLAWLGTLDDLNPILQDAVQQELQDRRWIRHPGLAVKPLPGGTLAQAERIVKLGYRAAAKEDHPDKGGATDAMKDLNEAISALRSWLRLVRDAKP